MDNFIDETKLYKAMGYCDEYFETKDDPKMPFGHVGNCSQCYAASKKLELFCWCPLNIEYEIVRLFFDYCVDLPELIRTENGDNWEERHDHIDNCEQCAAADKLADEWCNYIWDKYFVRPNTKKEYAVDMNELGLSPEPAGKTWNRGPSDMYYNWIQKTKAYMRSVPYQVSLRWLFYRLLQDGTLDDKSAYDAYKNVIAKARHSGYIGPDAIADEGRACIHLSGVWDTVAAWLDNFIARLNKGISIVDLMLANSPYVIVAYEARAMTAQFEMYARPYGVTLYPFGGDPSIPYKYELAKFIERIHENVVILYFGDLDEKGQSIGESAMRDIHKWCFKPFVAFHAGLTAEQVQDFDLPENPDHPGTFQWEALTDDQAEELITGALDKFVDLETIATANEIERQELVKIAETLSR